MTMALHKQLAERLLDNLDNGTWQVGQRLPPEEDLAKELNVSRSTLRKAFEVLELKKVIARKKRTGTTVIADRPSQVFLQTTGNPLDALKLADETIWRVAGIEDIDGSSDKQLSELHSDTGFWLKVSGTRYLPDAETPISVAQTFVPASFAGIRPLIKPEMRSLYRLIEKTFDIKVGRLTQSAGAIACPLEAALALGLKRGGPSLYVTANIYSKDDRLMLVTRSYFHPDRFKVQSDVRIL